MRTEGVFTLNVFGSQILLEQCKNEVKTAHDQLSFMHLCALGRGVMLMKII